MARSITPLLLVALLATSASRLQAQKIEPLQPNTAPNGAKLTPLAIPNLSKGQLELIQLESAFAADVAQGGGRAFGTWFADDAVTLNNGQPAVLGQLAIAATAQWNPKTYQLTWYAEGVQIGPSNDTGFTWGHYDGTTTLPDGKTSVTSGRYITFWKKVRGAWKVALDASAQEPASPTVAK